MTVARSSVRELLVREAATAWVGSRSQRRGGVLSRADLEAFSYDGEQIKLIDQSRGIRNPRQLMGTISILSSPTGPYDDVATADGLLRYAYRAGDPNGCDNRKLRVPLELGLPMILLQGIAPGVFVPTYPVYVVADKPDQQCFEIAVDESLRLIVGTGELDDAQRSYVEPLTTLRLHQPVFRARVLQADETTCAMCRLRHALLLDAAHILGDAQGGRPVVATACRCARSTVRRTTRTSSVSVLPSSSRSGQRYVRGGRRPMLEHGLPAMNGVALHLPRRADNCPNRQAVAERYDASRTGV